MVKELQPVKQKDFLIKVALEANQVPSVEASLIDLAARLYADPQAEGLGEVLAAAHAAFFGGAAKERNRLVSAARVALDGQLHVDQTGARHYDKGHRPVPLGAGPTARERGRYIRDRAQRAMQEHGADLASVARDVVAAVQNYWPVNVEGAKISSDSRLRAAIIKGEPEGVVRAALRAAGVKAPPNLFNADQQKRARSKP